MCAEGVAGHIHLASQLTVVGMRHKGRVAGIVESEQPSFLALLLRGVGGCLYSGVRKSGKIFLVGNEQREGLGVLQQVLGELQSEQRSFLGELAQMLLAGIVEEGTITHKAVVGSLEHHLLFRREFTVMVIDRLDACESLWVEQEVVFVLAEDRCELLCQRLHAVVGLSTHQAGEHSRHAVEEIVVVRTLAVVVVSDGIVKGRLLRIVEHRLNILVVASDAFHKGGLKVLKAYFVEGYRVMGRVVGLHERVLSFCCLVHHFLYKSSLNRGVFPPQILCKDTKSIA